jgi:hypothetical protein
MPSWARIGSAGRHGGRAQREAAAFVTVLLAFHSSQRIALYAGAVWGVAIVVAYAIHSRRGAPAG